ncbi:MAG TPA: thiamine biosynthesis protein ApbE, partial [Clostridiaceae bacterium]|nr:thiamine biosynthesis protein ApbE [Clostridiaceae bacterium]
LSTSVFAMGLDEGKKFVENTPGVDAIFVTKNKEVYITSGLKDSFSIVDNSFKLK